MNYYTLVILRKTSARLGKSELLGNEIAKAINTYRNENGKLPENLNTLVPHYLSKLPKVKTKFGLPRFNNAFKYKIIGFIPKQGDFKLTFSCKSDRKQYVYDSKTDQIIWNKISFGKSEYVTDEISLENINLLAKVIKKYYQDSLKYPDSLPMLIPAYLKKEHFNFKAQYKPSDVAPNYTSPAIEYSFHQPSDSFRGDFYLYFDVSFGEYYLYDNLKTGKLDWYYDD